MTLDKFIAECKIEKSGFIETNIVLDFLERSHLSINDENDLLKKIINYNHRVYKDTANRYKDLADVDIEVKKEINEPVAPIMEPNENEIVSTSSEVTDFYFDCLKNFNFEGKTIQDFYNILPKHGIKEFNNIINQLLLRLLKEKIIYEKLLRELNETEILVEIERINRIILEVRNYREMSNSKNGVEEKSTINKVIFAKTSSSNNAFIDDIEGLNFEIYDSFSELLYSIIDGTFKNIGKYKINKNNAYYKVKDVDTGARIIFTRYSDNIYVLLAAFVKKAQWGLLENNVLNNAISLYERYLPKLQEDFDLDFLADEQIKLEEVMQFLNSKGKGISRKNAKNS